MKLGPRAKLGLLAALFFAPIAASFFTYYFTTPQATANYGELLPPRPAPAFQALKGQWVLVVSDALPCGDACTAKVDATARVRLALGRNASRVQRVFVVEEGGGELAGDAAQGMQTMPRTQMLRPGEPGFDRAHIYLVDPHGDAMMRWPAAPERKRMLKDLERLLKASQIG